MWNSESCTKTGWGTDQIKFTVGYGFNQGSTSLPFETLYGQMAIKGEYRVDSALYVNDWGNFLYEYKPDFNVWGSGAQFKQQNGVEFSWVTHNSSAGNFSDLQVDPAIKNQWDWFAPDSIINVGPNFGNTGAPAPGFHRDSWPQTEAVPLPHLTIQGVR